MPLNKVQVGTSNTKEVCKYWDGTKKSYSTDGVQTFESQSGVITCKTNHFTDFATFTEETAPSEHNLIEEVLGHQNKTESFSFKFLLLYVIGANFLVTFAFSFIFYSVDKKDLKLDYYNEAAKVRKIT